MKPQKLSELSGNIDRKIKEQSKSTASYPSLGASTKIATDLVAGVLVGVLIGLSLDKWLATKPLFLIICLLLGIFAAIKNIMISLKQENAQ